jgi:hypothetical protein
VSCFFRFLSAPCECRVRQCHKRNGSTLDARAATSRYQTRAPPAAAWNYVCRRWRSGLSMWPRSRGQRAVGRISRQIRGRRRQVNAADLLTGDGPCFRRAAVPTILRSTVPSSQLSSFGSTTSPRTLWRLQRGEHVMEARFMPHAQYIAVVILVDGQGASRTVVRAPDRRPALGRRAASDQRSRRSVTALQTRSRAPT